LQLRSRPQNGFQPISHYSEAISGDLDDLTHWASAQTNRQSRPNEALVSHYTDFHGPAVFGNYNLRNHSPIQEIDELNTLSRLMKAEMTRQVDIL
jgi:hypothetical protein